MEPDKGIISGSIDMAAGLTILLSTVVVMEGNFILLFATLMLIKSLLHFFRSRTPLDPVAWVDLTAGIIFVLLYFSVFHSLFFVAGLLELIKGTFAFVTGIKLESG